MSSDAIVDALERALAMAANLESADNQGQAIADLLLEIHGAKVAAVRCRSRLNNRHPSRAKAAKRTIQKRGIQGEIDAPGFGAGVFGR